MLFTEFHVYNITYITIPSHVMCNFDTGDLCLPSWPHFDNNSNLR